jgi:hypothetical protein
MPTYGESIHKGSLSSTFRFFKLNIVNDEYIEMIGKNIKKQEKFKHHRMKELAEV